MGSERVFEFEEKINKVNWNIIGLSDVRRIGETLLHKPGYVFYHKGQTKGHRGVGFYIKTKWMKDVETIQGISERICFLKMKVGQNTKPLNYFGVGSNARGRKRRAG